MTKQTQSRMHEKDLLSSNFLRALRKRHDVSDEDWQIIMDSMGIDVEELKHIVLPLDDETPPL